MDARYKRGRAAANTNMGVRRQGASTEAAAHPWQFQFHLFHESGAFQSFMRPLLSPPSYMSVPTLFF